MKGLFLKTNFFIVTCRNWLKQYFLHIIFKVSQAGHNWPFTCLPDNYSMNKTNLKAVLHKVLVLFSTLSHFPHTVTILRRGYLLLLGNNSESPSPTSVQLLWMCVYSSRCQSILIILYDILNHKFRINCHVSCGRRREDLSSHQPLSSLDHHQVLHYSWHLMNI